MQLSSIPTLEGRNEDTTDPVSCKPEFGIVYGIRKTEKPYDALIWYSMIFQMWAKTLAEPEKVSRFTCRVFLI
jgi:hypothetical protein